MVYYPIIKYFDIDYSAIIELEDESIGGDCYRIKQAIWCGKNYTDLKEKQIFITLSHNSLFPSVRQAKDFIKEKCIEEALNKAAFHKERMEDHRERWIQNLLKEDYILLETEKIGE